MHTSESITRATTKQTSVSIPNSNDPTPSHNMQSYQRPNLRRWTCHQVLSSFTADIHHYADDDTTDAEHHHNTQVPRCCMRRPSRLVNLLPVASVWINVVLFWCVEKNAPEGNTWLKTRDWSAPYFFSEERYPRDPWAQIWTYLCIVMSQSSTQCYNNSSPAFSQYRLARSLINLDTRGTTIIVLSSS